MAEFNQWGAMCRDAGLRLAYHNHNFEFAPLEGTTGYDDPPERGRSEARRLRARSVLDALRRPGSARAVREVSGPLRDVARQGHGGHRRQEGDVARREGHDRLQDATSPTRSESGLKHFFVEHDSAAQYPGGSLASVAGELSVPAPAARLGATVMSHPSLARAASAASPSPAPIAVARGLRRRQLGRQRSGGGADVALRAARQRRQRAQVGLDPDVQRTRSRPTGTSSSPSIRSARTTTTPSASRTGCCKVRYDKWTALNGEFGHIFYKRPFTLLSRRGGVPLRRQSGDRRGAEPRLGDAQQRHHGARPVGAEHGAEPGLPHLARGAAPRRPQ